MLSKLVKRLGFAKNSMPYFGTRVFFPVGSHVAERAAHERVFEAHVVHLVLSLLKPNSVYLDVGANIGLLSVPILAMREDVETISIEATPKTLEYLARTRNQTRFRDRWHLVGEAVGAAEGRSPFFVRGDAFSAFDGLADTGRGGPAQEIFVQVTTIDAIWQRFGRSHISVIKLDIEGAELSALEDAAGMICECRPHIILEWNAENLKAYQKDPLDICETAENFGYRILSVPGLFPLGPDGLTDHMARSEMILLSPDPSWRSKD